VNQTEKLISYCMGALNAKARLEVEEDLLNSREVLVQFIALKRAIESNEMFEVEPRETLRSKLRQSVAQEFSISQSVHSPLILWKHLFAQKQTLAYALCVLLILVSGGVYFLKPGAVPDQIKGGLAVDGANESPVNFNFL